MVYSRDAMAGPLRALEQMLFAIREQDFHPDKTRSGYFTSKVKSGFLQPTAKTRPTRPSSSSDTEWNFVPVTDDGYQILAEPVPAVEAAEVVALEATLDSDDQDSSESSSSDSSEGDGITDVVAHKALSKCRPPLPRDTEGKIPYFHPTSAVLHFRLEGMDRLNCGRQLSKVLIKTKWQKSLGLINCAQCFKPANLLPHVLAVRE